MVYMVVEHFKNGDARPIYRRFRERGRLAPEGLTYVTSWVAIFVDPEGNWYGLRQQHL